MKLATLQKIVLWVAADADSLEPLVTAATTQGIQVLDAHVRLVQRKQHDWHSADDNSIWLQTQELLKEETHG